MVFSFETVFVTFIESLKEVYGRLLFLCSMGQLAVDQCSYLATRIARLNSCMSEGSRGSRRTTGTMTLEKEEPENAIGFCSCVLPLRNLLILDAVQNLVESS